MKNIYYFIIIFSFFIFNLCSVENKNTGTVLQKIILDSTSDSKEYTFDFSVKNQIISVLDNIDSENKIIYLKEINWIRYRDLITDSKNKKNISEFFLKSDVRAILKYKIAEEKDRYIIKISLLKVVENILKDEKFEIRKKNIIEDFRTFRILLFDLLIKEFRPIDRTKLYKEIISQRTIVRDNPLYELTLGGGSGFFSRSDVDTGNDVQCLGFSLYTKLEGKIKNFAVSSNANFSPLFNNNTNYDLFSYNLTANLDFGGWFYSEMFKFGGGTGLIHGNVYVKESNDSYKRIKTDYYFLLFYLSFVTSPIRNVQILVNIGAFFSPDKDINTIGLMMYWPVYVNFNFRYFFYKNNYFEIDVPFYMANYSKQGLFSNKMSPFLFGVINIGFGYRLEWRKK